MLGVLLEPSRQDVHGQPTLDQRHLSPAHLRLAGAVGAGLLVVASSGEVVLLVTLLSLVSGHLVTAAAVALAGLAWTVRWGSTSLAAMSGAQAVLGAGGMVGPPAAAASAWCAGGALVLAGPRGWAAVAFGLAAGFGVAGPALASFGDLAVRSAGAAGGVGLAVVAARRAAPEQRRLASVGLAATGAGLAALA